MSKAPTEADLKILLDVLLHKRFDHDWDWGPAMEAEIKRVCTNFLAVYGLMAQTLEVKLTPDNFLDIICKDYVPVVKGN